MPYVEFHCVHLLYSSVQFEKIWGGAGTKWGWGEGDYTLFIRYVLMKVNLWLRREQGYLSVHASRDRKAGRLSLPFYSIEFFATNTGGQVYQ